MKNPWILGIGTTVIGGIVLSFVLDLINGVDLLSTLNVAVIFIVNIVISFLNLKLKVWWLLLGISVIIIVLVIIAKISETKKNTELKTPSYIEDRFAGWKWTWNWHFNTYDGNWYVEDLKAHCPKCDTPLFHDRHDTHFECPRCNFETDHRSKHKTRKQVEAIIVDNANRMKKQQEQDQNQ